MSMDPTRLESLGDADDFRIYGVQSMQRSRRVPAAQGKEHPSELRGWLAEIRRGLQSATEARAATT
jgi:hypothetical protein